MTRYLSSLALLIALVGSLLVAPLSATAQSTESVEQVVNVTGERTGPGSSARSGMTFEGTFTIDEFFVEDGQLMVTGLLEGDLLNRAGRVVQSISQQLTAPIGSVVDGNGNGVCEVLFLRIEGIELRLLGLIVLVDPIQIQILADPEGGILGQLLCALAGGPINLPEVDLQLLAATLNQLLG